MAAVRVAIMVVLFLSVPAAGCGLLCGQRVFRGCFKRLFGVWGARRSFVAGGCITLCVVMGNEFQLGAVITTSKWTTERSCLPAGACQPAGE